MSENVGVSSSYSVKSGDTLSGIAKAHGFSSWRDIYYAPENAAFRTKRPNPDKIFPGDVLVLPAKGRNKSTSTMKSVPSFFVAPKSLVPPAGPFPIAESMLLHPVFPLKKSDKIVQDFGPSSGVGFGRPRPVNAPSRSHAGVDLVTNKEVPIHSIWFGKVLKIIRDFKPVKHSNKNDAVIVDHLAFIALYGEIRAEVSEMDVLAPGERLGRTIRMDNDFMLHFEIYSGMAAGERSRHKPGAGEQSPVGANGLPFNRRSDLMDPTTWLKFLQSNELFP